MKRFKFWIVGLFTLLFLSSFCSATVYDTYSGTCYNKNNFCKSTTSLNLSNCDGDYYLLFLATGDVNWELRMPGTSFLYSSSDKFYGQSFSCSTYTQFSLIDRSNNGFDYVLKIVDYDEILNIGNSNGGSCPECPEIDINYCVENDLCPVPSNFSQLFINDIEHESAPLINVSIPEEFDWDSSIDSGQFNLDVVGYNVDTEYIDGIIRTQKTTPNNTDFNNIVSGLIPLLIPGLVIILFIYFIFRFIKKVF